MTLAERIAELESKLEDYKKSRQEYRRQDGIMPWALKRATERVEFDLDRLRELHNLRAITRGIIAGDHEAISRGLLAALGDELVLRVTHELLMRLAEASPALANLPAAPAADTGCPDCGATILQGGCRCSLLGAAKYDGSTGAEFVEAATEALGGGLVLTEEQLTELGHLPAAGPLLPCGRLLLRDCRIDGKGCPGLCEPADEAFPF